MKQKLQLHIPEPCHEDWNKMTTTQQGRYCQNCCKQVVDFTTMSDVQIMEYLSNTAQKTCGRFKNSQLERPLQNNTRKNYWTWLTTSMAMLFVFFSCKSKKPVVGELQPVEVKKDTVRQCNIEPIMGVIATPPKMNDSTTKMYLPQKNKK